ncbi:MAG: hypothetical protein LC768_03420 [Acidobacteria bacterium]|nr:hypothetical protein [Acidobacteriota bacterium]
MNTPPKTDASIAESLPTARRSLFPNYANETQNCFGKQSLQPEPKTLFSLSEFTRRY